MDDALLVLEEEEDREMLEVCVGQWRGHENKPRGTHLPFSSPKSRTLRSWHAGAKVSHELDVDSPRRIRREEVDVEGKWSRNRLS